MMNRYRFPFVLQIACDRKAKVYDLIKEIIGICDVNMGLLGTCKDYYFRSRGHCVYRHKTFYPTSSTVNSMDDLTSNQDSPIIIDGDGNMRAYNILLREVANIPIKRTPLGTMDRFKLLPIFVCSSIKQQFDNVFDMDLTNFDVSDYYLEQIRESKQILASWIFELVMNFKNYLFQNCDMKAQNPDESHFSEGIRERVNYIHTKFTSVILEDARDIGFLDFFFNGFLTVADKMTNLDPEDKIKVEFNGKPRMFSSHELIERTKNVSQTCLLQAHKEYSSLQMQMGKIEADGNVLEAAETAEKWAGAVIEHFEAFKVSIFITKYEVNGEKYIFYVRPLKGTSYKKIKENAENVRESMAVAVLEVQSINDTNAIILSEQPLNENSLVKILDSTAFIESNAVIPYAVGYDSSGAMVIADIFDFPHLLIGGTTKSGKSTALYSILLSILHKKGADEVNFLIFDYGKTELVHFSKMPHLSHSIITTGPKGFDEGYKTVLALQAEMNRRLPLYQNDRATYDKLPYIVCIIDEFQKFINELPEKNDREMLLEAILKLLATARGAKIHMIIATQNPTVRNLKIDPANLDAKIALKCSNIYASKAIIGCGGAEKLTKGSLYFRSAEYPENIKLKSSFISEGDLVKKLEGMTFNYEYDSTYKFTVAEQDGEDEQEETEGGSLARPRIHKDDSARAEAIILSLSRDEIAVSHLIEELGIAHPKAARVMKKLYELGIVGEVRKNKPRKTIPLDVKTISNSEEIMEVLLRNKYTMKQIEEAIAKRPSDTSNGEDSV
jgi:S-DNA-T family DNA segregation ATPase FtsK/SpoIIIE